MKKIRDRLCIFSGEDFSIIRKCETNIQFYFSLIGGFVLTILICCFISAFLFTESLFNNPIQDFGIAIIWGFIVTNLYVLLLYTISPAILPTSKKENNLKVVSNKVNSINASFVLRIMLLIILAIIIAQPLNVAIFSNYDTKEYAKTIKFLLSTNVLAWLITSLVALIFLLPVYWKYTIRNLGGFYEVKANIEKRIIEDDYIDFKKDFKRLLENNISNFNKKTWENTMPFLNKLEIVSKEKYNNLFSEITKELKNETIEKYEYWADPPFRTIKKNNTKTALTEEDFLTDIYSN
jgi:NADH:ubiquinone oxidoreductase subunit 5 (subunit L)/multisubunit Na+/H+ antiporter MnhA subunit